MTPNGNEIARIWGAQAYLNGVPRDQCPFKAHREAWLEGWDLAQREAGEAEVEP